jgi:molybdate-binding protein
MAQFQVSSECYPGVQRDSGFFKPGAIMEWSATDQKPSMKFIPLDKEAYQLLVKSYGEKDVLAKYGKSFVEQAKPEVVKDTTHEDLKKQSKSTRAADR